jgi:hypothetical protein
MMAIDEAMRRRMPASLSVMLQVAQRQKKQATESAFTDFAPLFGHFGITVTCKGKRDPVWTLKSAGKTIKVRVTAEGTVEVVEADR